ncbi:MAG: hypothetical protein A3J28_05400 [Acidobacteria bacterium RIFCSPLOWO2_12_FULL_60_22]|nr:MAG: hypothetical protein A3J28_05400 [Acidobacteria bacterium RIFCSPLOWO2_12_FULL_60_22]
MDCRKPGPRRFPFPNGSALRKGGKMLSAIFRWFSTPALQSPEEHRLALRRFERNRQRIAWLSVLGVVDSGYLFLYQTGRLKHLWCPGFGKACERIAGSPRAYQGRVPDSLLGAAGYATLLALALAGGRERYRSRPALPLLMGGSTLAAFGLSVLLTYAQKAEFDDFCVWCLASAALSTLTVPLAMPEFLAALNAGAASTAAPGRDLLFPGFLN